MARGVIILLLVACEGYAQTYVGPIYQALGNTGAALRGINSLTANPAGLTGLERTTVGLGHQHHFLTTDITTQAAQWGMPTRLGVFGLAVNRYGLKTAYQEIKGGFSFAKQFGGRFSVGVSANYHQLYIPSYLSIASFSIDLGIQYFLEQGTIIGLQCTNLGNVGYRRDVYGEIPSFIRVGATYPLIGAFVTADAIYRMDHTLGGHVGLEYSLTESVCVRGGVSLNPMQQHAGFGIHWLEFMFDVAATFHSRLGMSPQIGICYAF